MHQAPPVAYPLGKVQTLRRCVALAWALVLVIDVYWLGQAQWQDWKPWLGLSLTALAGASAYRFRPAGRDGLLQWDSRGWSHREGESETAGVVTVHLDLQSVLLVYWASASGPGAWYWLSAAAQPSRWLALRRAVFAPDRTTQGQSEGGAQRGLVVRP